MSDPARKPSTEPPLPTALATVPADAEAVEHLLDGLRGGELVVMRRSDALALARPQVDLAPLVEALQEAMPAPQPAEPTTPTMFEYAVINCQQGQLWVDGAVEFRSSRAGAASLGDALQRLSAQGFRQVDSMTTGMVKQIIMERPKREPGE